MESSIKAVGLAFMALSAYVALGFVLQPTSGPQTLYAPVTLSRATGVATHVIDGRSKPSSNSPAKTLHASRPSVLVASNMDVQASVSPRSTDLSTQLLSLALIPLAAAIGYFAGKYALKAPALGPVDVFERHGYVMLSTAGAEAVAEATEAVAEAAEPAPEKKPAVKLETSFAKIIESIEKKYLKSDVPDIQIGDTVVVGVRIKEGDKERVQDYQGVVIAMKNGGLHKSINVRAVLQGVGVERVFPVHAPQVAYIKIVKRSKVRRAKLYYLRDRAGKAARLKQRFVKLEQ